VKATAVRDAIALNVHDGDMIALEGFTASIFFAAAHEIIRQGKRNLTLCRMTLDPVHDQTVAAGSARKVVFSNLGNPGVGSLQRIRRAVEKGTPGRRN
jgi:glutaconate CoA-transferase subunit A